MAELREHEATYLWEDLTDFPHRPPFGAARQSGASTWFWWMCAGPWGEVQAGGRTLMGGGSGQCGKEGGRTQTTYTWGLPSSPMLPGNGRRSESVATSELEDECGVRRRGASSGGQETRTRHQRRRQQRWRQCRRVERRPQFRCRMIISIPIHPAQN
jgi:hypothetical protein